MSEPDDNDGWIHWTLRGARRAVIALVGATVVLLGAAMLVLPGPGMIVIPVGLGILGLEFAWARRWLRRVREHADRALEAALGNSGEPATSARPAPAASQDERDDAR